MYDWPPEILTDWERNVAPHFTPQQYRELNATDKIDVKIAYAKVSINIAIVKLQAALKALPWPPHEVQVWCRAINPEFGMALNGVMSARRVDENLRQIYSEDHPEYKAYFFASQDYEGKLAALSMYRNKYAQIDYKMKKKSKKNTAQSEL